MIYLDHASTTPLDPRVLEAMMPYLTEEFGNASSIHQGGQRARRAIDDARNSVIHSIGANNVHEIIFTGSGTESCNMAIFGAAFAAEKPGHLIVSAIEHPAVLEPARYLRDNFGFTLTEVKPNTEGFMDPKEIESAIQPDTILVSVMLANNEIGTIQPVKEIAELCRARGILFHTDACQAPGYTEFRVDELQPDLLTLNGGKLYGPKGVGMLYVRQGVKITPHVHGGGQEFRMRGGTENVANIVGFAKALELTLAEDHKTQIAQLRDDALEKLLSLPGITLNGARTPRLVNNINLSLPGITGETAVMRLDMAGIAVSSGSACSSGKTEASPVLLAMGQSPEQASQSLRITLGRTTKEADLSQLLSEVNSLLA